MTARGQDDTTAGATSGTAAGAARRPAAGRLRVEWSPGSDRLTGVCHCGAEHRADGPVEVWTWLLAHCG
ncbi:hypothetical protein ACFHW2_37460 [Actinomadura sp. LOL_016]|uniref:hypothetical protein n=1 Tax=unclassified Actinomadura TaxID=2626254 RepID=UPI003A7F7CF5